MLGVCRPTTDKPGAWDCGPYQWTFWLCHICAYPSSGKFLCMVFSSSDYLLDSSLSTQKANFVSFSCTFFAALCFMWKMNSKLEEEKKLGGWMVRSNVSSSFLPFRSQGAMVFWWICCGCRIGLLRFMSCVLFMPAQVHLLSLPVWCYHWGFTNSSCGVCHASLCCPVLVEIYQWWWGWGFLLGSRCGIGDITPRRNEPCELWVCCLPEFKENRRCACLEWGQ